LKKRTVLRALIVENVALEVRYKRVKPHHAMNGAKI
jgi:hypothetical protein